MRRSSWRTAVGVARSGSRPQALERTDARCAECPERFEINAWQKESGERVPPVEPSSSLFVDHAKVPTLTVRSAAYQCFSAQWITSTQCRPCCSKRRRCTPTHRTACYTTHVDRGDLLPWWEGAFAELHAAVQAQTLDATGPSGGEYASEIFQDDHGQATLFLSVANPVRAIGRVQPLQVPAAELPSRTGGTHLPGRRMRSFAANPRFLVHARSVHRHSREEPDGSGDHTQ